MKNEAHLGLAQPARVTHSQWQTWQLCSWQLAMTLARTGAQVGLG